MLAQAWKVLVLLATVIGVGYAAVAVPVERYNPQALEYIDELSAQLVDEPALDFTLQDLDGNRHALSDFRGRLVFLNFWASWCAPCREEMPSMVRLAADLNARDFVMIAISHDEELGDLEGFLAETGIPREAMLVLRDPEGQIARSYGTELLPETYLIDDNGRVIARFQNAYEWDQPRIRGFIELLMRQPWRHGTGAN